GGDGSVGAPPSRRHHSPLLRCFSMVFEHIEKLKRDYTDRFVVIKDENRPELSRFQGQTGRVKTVNMNGKALVEFPNWANIGWYDIDVDYLKVVERPVPKAPEKKAAAKKPAAKKAAGAKPEGGEKKLSALELARMQGAAGSQQAEPAVVAEAKSKPAEKLSTADILAAARGKSVDASPAAKTQATSAPAEKQAAEMTLAEKLAAMRGEKSGAGEAGEAGEAAVEPPTAGKASASGGAGVASDKPISEMTLEEKLAAMRGEKTAAAAQPPEEAAEPPTELAEPAAADSPSDATSGETVDKSTMSIDDMLGWCRAHDSES
ncbi:MAG: hypothetical protein VB875_06910, partial [Pirellulales bacterium]